MAKGKRIYLEFEDGKSHKFWEGFTDGSALTTRWGRAGTDGQSKDFEFGDDAAAVAELDKKAKAKIKKGYVEQNGAASAKKTAKKAKAKSATKTPVKKKTKRAAGKKSTRPVFPKMLKDLGNLWDGEELEFYDDWEDLSPWGLPKTAQADLFAFAASHDGSYAALWRIGDRPLEEWPVVVLGSEGETGVIADNLDSFLDAAARGWSLFALLELADKADGQRAPDALAFLKKQGVGLYRGVSKSVEKCQTKHANWFDFVEGKTSSSTKPTKATKGPQPIDKMATWRFKTSCISGPTRLRASDDLLFTVIDDRLFAIRRDDGKKAWMTKLASDAWHSPVVSGDELYLGDSSGTVFRIDASSGKVIWKQKTPGMINGAVALGNGQIVVGTGEGAMVGIARDSGKTVWSYTSEAADDEQEYEGDVLGFAELALATSRAGELVAWRIGNGKIAWRSSLKPAPPFGGEFDVHRIGKQLLVRGFRKKSQMAHLVEPKNGKVVWSTRVDAVVGAFGDDDRVIVVGHDGLQALDVKTGKQRWKLARQDTRSAALIEPGRGLLATNHRVAEVDLTKGEVLSESKEQSKIYLDSVACFDGTVYVATYDSVLRLEI